MASPAFSLLGGDTKSPVINFTVFGSSKSEPDSIQTTIYGTPGYMGAQLCIPGIKYFQQHSEHNLQPRELHACALQIVWRKCRTAPEPAPVSLFPACWHWKEEGTSFTCSVAVSSTQR